MFIERFWRYLKYEYVFLHPVEDGTELKAGLKSYIAWYNQSRPHSSLDDLPRDTVYAGGIMSNCAA